MRLFPFARNHNINKIKSLVLLLGVTLWRDDAALSILNPSNITGLKSNLGKAEVAYSLCFLILQRFIGSKMIGNRLFVAKNGSFRFS
jgi:hypothetical protein